MLQKSVKETYTIPILILENVEIPQLCNNSVENAAIEELTPYNDAW